MGVPANENDWIAAFDAAGNCAGAAQVVMNEGLAYINLPIYGDDATTEGVDEGIETGEFFTLHLWRSTYGGVFELSGNRCHHHFRRVGQHQRSTHAGVRRSYDRVQF